MPERRALPERKYRPARIHGGAQRASSPTLAGARLRHYYPVSLVTHGLAINITVQSHAGQLEFGLTACDEVVARPGLVAKAIASAFTELKDRLPE